MRVWFSPNMPQRQKPTSKTKKTPTAPDLTDVYRLMRRAKEAILFLAFYPGQKGKDCIIGEVINIGLHDRSLLVSGADSSAQAMPNYVAKKKDEEGKVVDEGDSPATFDDRNVSLFAPRALTIAIFWATSEQSNLPHVVRLARSFMTNWS